MKKILILIACVVISTSAWSQTYIKANALYWAVLVTNVSVETKIGEKFTFNTDAVFSPWNSVGGKPYLIGQLIPEVRFYPKEANNGFYVGLYGAFHAFKMSKWNYDSDKYQKGFGYAFGATVGYELPIGKRWLMDFYAGGGWQTSKYRGYDTATDAMYVGYNGSGEWIPYKVGVAFAYRINKKAK